MENFVRKMAQVKIIDEIIPHDNADALEIAIIGGWQCVVKKGEFTAGSKVVYFAIDSWVPDTIAPFLSKGKVPRVYNGVPGERLKTIKLRGQLSQGLVLSCHSLAEKLDPYNLMCDELEEDTDVSEILGVQKWEAEVPACLRGMSRGNFPAFIRKTDAERAQNLKRELFGDKANPETRYEVSIKVDGSSMTVGCNEGEVVVCSRNINLKLDNLENSFVSKAHELELIENLPKLGRNIAIQGELYGEGIQKNPEKIKGIEFVVFNIWDIDKQCYMPVAERMEIVKQLGLEHTQVLHENVTFSDLGINDMNDLLEFAEGPSLNPSVSREGVVFKSMDGKFMFKSISNSYLLRHDG